jgi:hypothetical protein
MSPKLLFTVLAFAASLSAGAETAQQMEASPRAQLVVYRTPGWIGSLVPHVVMVNGQRAAKLKSKTYTNLSLPPGQCTVCIFGDELCLEPFEIKAGETYFIRDTSDPKKYAGSSNQVLSIYLDRVDATAGQEQSVGLKQVEPESGFK